MDEEPDFTEMSYEQIEDYIRHWLTPERKALRLAWIKMSIALAPEITLGAYPDD